MGGEGEGGEGGWKNWELGIGNWGQRVVMESKVDGEGRGERGRWEKGEGNGDGDGGGREGGLRRLSPNPHIYIYHCDLPSPAFIPVANTSIIPPHLANRLALAEYF